MTKNIKEKYFSDVTIGENVRIITCGTDNPFHVGRAGIVKNIIPGNGDIYIRFVNWETNEVEECIAVAVVALNDIVKHDS